MRSHFLSTRRPILLGLIFSFCFLGFQPAQACQWALSTSDEFPVKDYFPKVKVDLGPDGQLIFSKSSRAFITWRQRTAPHIPDRAFAFQYLTRDQLIRHVVEAAEDIPIEKDSKVNTPRESPRTLVFPEGLNPADLNLLGDFISHFVITRPQLKMMSMNYLLFSDEKNQIIPIAFNDIYSHQKAIHLLRKTNPSLKVVEGGYIELALEEKSSFLFRYSTGLRWIYDHNGTTTTGLQLDKHEVLDQLKQEIRSALAQSYQLEDLDLQPESFQPQPVQRESLPKGPMRFRLNLK